MVGKIHFEEHKGKLYAVIQLDKKTEKMVRKNEDKKLSFDLDLEWDD